MIQEEANTVPDEKKVRLPTIQRLRGTELESLYSLLASLKEIRNAREAMESRLRSIPNGLRDISMLWAVLSKLIDKLIETIPADKRLSLTRNARHMVYRVYAVKPVSLPHDMAFIATNDLSALAKAAHDYACTACDNDCNKCDLGKALDHIMVQCRARNESWSWISGVGDYKGGEPLE